MEPLPDAACGGENIGMLDWLQTQGFDPFTQPAAYYRLTDDAPEANTVEVSVQKLRATRCMHRLRWKR